MRLRGIALLRHSLIGRMTLLSIAFIVFTLIGFVFVPYLSYWKEDPHAATRRLVLAALHEGLAQPDRQGALDGSSILREVAAENPRFRYYVRKGGWQASYGGEPKWQDAAREARTLTAGNEHNTAYWSAAFQEERGTAQASYQFAGGKETYIEIAGVENPIERKVLEALPAINSAPFWEASRHPLIAALGVLGIALIVLLFAARSLRGLTRAVRSFNVGGGIRNPLPEEGLPIEVAPLIHAINEMVDRMEATHAQQELFLATAAHELRTPLTILRTRLEMLVDSDVKQELRQDLRRMSTLVDQLLQLMSIRNRQGDLPEDVDLVATVREAIAERVPLGLRRGVDMELTSDTGSLPMRGDRDLLKIALVNLLDNALSSSRRGDTLTVAIDPNGSVSVHFGGASMAESDLERIFDPFAKKQPNRTGHDLGLAIVKAIMSLHGGTVSAHNNAERGVTFTLQWCSNHSPSNSET